MNRDLSLFLVLSALLAVVPAALAQRNLQLAPAPAGEQRVALVIGNGTYKDSPLANPVNDSRDIAVALSGLGFKVTVRENLNQRAMKQAIREFGNQLSPGGVALFYFAGHGVQLKGRNFLIPVGEDISAEDEVEDQSVDVNLVLEKLETSQSRVNVVILDACRNNPFQRRFRSASRGLAPLDAVKGSLVAFATAPGSVASDGTGRNGVYTKHLLASLQHPDSAIENVFKRVRQTVFEETRGQQVPWESSSLIGDFYFNPDATPQGTSAAAPAVRIDTPLAVEIAFWQSIQGTNRAADFEAYLRRYPGGQFVDLARSRLASPPPVAPIQAPAQPSAAAAQRATVFVFRKSNWIGGAVDYFLTNRGRAVGKLVSGSYVMHSAQAGELTLSAEGGYSVSRTWEIEPGKTYYIELEHNLANVELRMIEESEGSQALKALRMTSTSGG